MLKKLNKKNINERKTENRKNLLQCRYKLIAGEPLENITITIAALKTKQMKAGDILLFKPGTGKQEWIARIIAWGTNSKYAHVAICVNADMHLAIEAMAGPGVRAIDIRKISQQYDIYRIKSYFNYDLNSMISYLVSSLNRGYDYSGVLWLGIMKLLIKIGIPLKETANRWQKDRDYFCSELCHKAFYDGGGIDIVPDVLETDITSPGDISRSALLELLY